MRLTVVHFSTRKAYVEYFTVIVTYILTSVSIGLEIELSEATVGSELKLE